jgi:hypothetical protein
MLAFIFTRDRLSATNAKVRFAFAAREVSFAFSRHRLDTLDERAV